MDDVKLESGDPKPSTACETQSTDQVKTHTNDQSVKAESKAEVKYFHCEICALHECYDYFGQDPPCVKQYKLLEDAYVIEDPFVSPKQNEFIILGSHCIKCRKSVCKDINCSIYYNGTYCIYCAKECIDTFPENVQEKLNRIIT